MELFKTKKIVIHSLVSSLSSITGNLEFQGGVEINGRVDGNVTGSGAGSSVSIGPSAVINGTVRAETVIIDGTVNGPIFASSTVLVKGKGKVLGDVSYGSMQMNAGAIVHGRLIPTRLDDQQTETDSEKTK